MDKKEVYKNVSCDFIDQIEIFATKKQTVSIAFIEDGSPKMLEEVIKTWYTKEKVEYLETANGNHIRLDNIESINDIKNSDSCKI